MKGGLNAISVVIVEICENNFITKLDLENILETEYPEVSVLETDCLSFFGMCAATPEECLAKIRDVIQQELAFFHE